MTSVFKPTIIILYCSLIVYTASVHSAPLHTSENSLERKSKQDNLLLIDYMKKQVLSDAEINTVLGLLTKEKKTTNIASLELNEQNRQKEVRNLVHMYKRLRTRFNKKTQFGQLIITALDNGKLNTVEYMLKKATSKEGLRKQQKKININNIFALANISELRNDSTKTIEYYGIINELAPENIPAWHLKANKLVYLGQQNKALEIWKNMQLNAEKANDTFSVAYGLKGEIESIIALGGNDDLAYEKYEKLQELILKNQQKTKALRENFNY